MSFKSDFRVLSGKILVVWSVKVQIPKYENFNMALLIDNLLVVW